MNHGLAVIPRHWVWNAVFLDWGDAGGLGIVRTISELRLIYGGACIHLGYCPNRYWASSYKKDLDE